MCHVKEETNHLSILLIYLIDLFQFKESDAHNSLGAFMEGLFKDRNAVQVEKVPENDTLLTVITLND